MRKAERLGLVILALTMCIEFDQALKIVAKAILPSVSTVSFLGGIVQFTYTENPGAFLGLGADWPGSVRFVILIVLVAVILTLLLSFTIRSRVLNLSQLMGMALITGGGLSNLIDRIIREGRVIDYVTIGFGNIRTGIFNFADVAVMLGVIVLIFSTPTDQENIVDTLYTDGSTRGQRRRRR